MPVHRSQPFHFFSADSLPEGFNYPQSFIEFVANNPDAIIGPVNEDWCFVDERQIGNFQQYVKRAAPNLPLVPFMRRNGDDGVACFHAEGLGAEPTVYLVNSNQDVGAWNTSKSFAEWLQSIPPREEDD